MELLDVKADEYVAMSENLRRVFIAGGCDPTCHCCNKKISLGEQFKLATVSSKQAIDGNRFVKDTFKTVDSHEVMLCADCSVVMMINNARLQNERSRLQSLIVSPSPRRFGGGCSIINGKIIPG